MTPSQQTLATLRVHPAAEIFPLMDDATLAALAADVGENGLRERLWLAPDGSLLDGRNRLRACEIAGVEPEFRTWSGTGSPVAFVLSLNLHRRHLTESQRAMIGARTKPLFEDEARARQAAGGGDQKSGSAHLRYPMEDAAKSSHQAAALVQVSPRSVENAAKVLRAGVPELVEAVERGEVRVGAAVEVAKLPEDEQRAVVEAGPAAVVQRAREGRAPAVKAVDDFEHAFRLMIHACGHARTLTPPDDLAPDRRKEAAADVQNGISGLEHLLSQLTGEHVPDLLAELEAAHARIERLTAEVESLSATDSGKEIRSWSARYAQLDARVGQLLTTQAEAGKTNRYMSGVLSRIRKALNVEKDAQIVEAINDLKR